MIAGDDRSLIAWLDHPLRVEHGTLTHDETPPWYTDEHSELQAEIRPFTSGFGVTILIPRNCNIRAENV